MNRCFAFVLVAAVALAGCDVSRKPIDPNSPIGPDNKPSPGPVATKVLDRSAYCEALALDIESRALTSSTRLNQIVNSHFRAGRITQATSDAISAAFPQTAKEHTLGADDAKTIRGLKG
jgi:hypothetical protein